MTKILASSASLVAFLTLGTLGLGPLALSGCEADASPGATADTGGSKSDTGAAGSDTGTPGDSAGGDTPATTSEELIDDMESATGSIASTKGRNGAWYTYNDTTVGAVQTPIAGAAFLPEKLATPRGTSKYAAHTKGSGFTTWGAGMGFDLSVKASEAGTTKSPYDASAYSGLTFWGRVEATSVTKVRLHVSTHSTDEGGGVCTPKDKCGDDYGTDLAMTTDWVKYTVPFTDLSQEGWGTPSVPAFEQTQTIAIHFQLAKGADFDVWIDDISFIKK